jgi:small subunit ribosomal protein S7
MSRKKRAKVKDLMPDAKYGSSFIAQLINYVMRCGKKSVAEKIVYDALEYAAQKINVGPVEVLDKVSENVAPQVELRSVRVGGATYQVPFEVAARRGRILMLRWLLLSARTRKSEYGMAAKLGAELLEAASGRGGAVKRKEDGIKMAEANRAFSHFRQYGN